MRRLSTNQPKKLHKTGGPQGGTRVEEKIFEAADVTSGGQSILAKKKGERDQEEEHARWEKCRERNFLLRTKTLIFMAHIWT